MDVEETDESLGAAGFVADDASPALLDKEFRLGFEFGFGFGAVTTGASPVVSFCSVVTVEDLLVTFGLETLTFVTPEIVVFWFGAVLLLLLVALFDG